jgi:hypothetical protein
MHTGSGQATGFLQTKRQIQRCFGYIAADQQLRLYTSQAGILQHLLPVSIKLTAEQIYAGIKPAQSFI